MARSLSRRSDRVGNTAAEHARLPIQLERLPFATLDNRITARQQLSLSLVYGPEITTWEASATAPDAPAAVLPGPFGNDLWVALGRIWNTLTLPEGVDVSPPLVRTIEVTYGDLLRLMNKTRGQTQYEAIEETVDRLRSVLIVAQGTWKDGDYIREKVSFPLFEMTRIRTRRDGDAAKNTITLRLSVEVAQALVRHPRYLDTSQLYRLSSPTARRLYRLLEAERFNRDRRGVNTLTIELTELSDRLPMEYADSAQMKRALVRAHDELVAEEFLTTRPTYVSEKIRGVRAPAVKVTYTFPPVVEGLLGVAVTSTAATGQPIDEPRVDNAAREQLASLLGMSVGPGAQRTSDLTWWVREIERATGDAKSSGFFKQVVEAFAAVPGGLEALEFVLRGVERDGAGTSAKVRGSAFTSRIKARATALHISLPAAVPNAARGGTATKVGALLAIDVDGPADPP